ncbi:hypothetical protein [Clostridium saccharoperbutylacetonicum]|uniref:hypothetical protein n=1 Tax=Clostridium saccharoperbutylacetonicum TaxID=36745 RepID=UPI0039ED5ECA
MRKLTKKIISNKLYMGCLIVVFMQYVFRVSYIKQALFNTTNVSSISQYGLLILAIVGATFLAGTILFSSLYIFILIFRKFTLPTMKKIFKILNK